MSDDNVFTSSDGEALLSAIRRQGRFEPIRLVGSGGMADVILARDKRLGVLRALKVIKPALMQRQDIVSRFLDEARAMCAIEHYHVLRVFDIVDLMDGDRLVFHYLVLEWCGGGSLDQHIERTGGMPARQAVVTLIGLCEGLKLAHALSIFHRDIKPDNVLITETGVAKLADFGIARINLDDAERKTATRMGMGSLGYMPPEQVTSASKVNAAYDIHALGMTLWHMISGMRPQVDPLSLLEWYQRFQSDDTLMEAIPPVLVPVLRRATCLKNADRYPTIDAFIQALEEVLPELPTDPLTVTPLGVLKVPSAPPQAVTRPVDDDALRIGTLHESNGQISEVDLGVATVSSGRSRALTAVLGLVAVMVCVVIGLVVWNGKEPAPEPAPVVAVVMPASALSPPSREPMIPSSLAPSTQPVSSASAPVSAPVSTSVEPKKPHPASVPPKAKDPVKREPLVTGVAAPVMIAVPPSDPPPARNARVNLSAPPGDPVQVWLQGPSGKFRLPSSVPPGTYQVIAQFDGRAPMMVIGSLPVTIETPLTLNCRSDFVGCKH